MKRAGVVLILVLVVVGVSAGEDVSLSELPQAVRATVESQTNGFKIDQIERDDDDGKIVYEVEVDGDNDMKIKIAEDGTLLEREEELESKDLPASILNAVKKMVGDVDFDDVEKEYRLDRGTIYKFEIEKGNLRIDMEMKEDGSVIKKRVRDNGDDMPGSLRKVRNKFMPLRGQLKVVVIGDSRAEKGVDPQYFLGEENQKHPIAFSFGPCARGMAMAQLLCEDYFAHGSKMEWVIYGMSGRVLNKYYTPGNNEDDIKESRGYLADKAAWATLPEVEGMVEFGQIDTDDSSQWGFDGKDEIKDDISERGERERTIRELSGKGRFILEHKRIEMLESAIKALARNNINLLVFTPPIHPISTAMPCTDDDGTNREAHDLIVAQMNALDKKYPNFYFLDVNKKGEHGLEHECFYDLDHLNIRGAKKLSLRLNDFMKAVDSGKKKNIDKK
ncbi:MAG: PepSY-like domain-containing protein [Planctomycetota bacterium]|jgi:hypothetical protein